MIQVQMVTINNGASHLSLHSGIRDTNYLQEKKKLQCTKLTEIVQLAAQQSRQILEIVKLVTEIKQCTVI